MENREKVLEALKSLHYLIYKRAEYGGYICLITGMILGLIEGDKNSVAIDSSKDMRIKGMWELAAFHSHTSSLSMGPTDADCFMANINGVTNYLIDVRGIWEIKPKILASLEDIDRAWLEAKARYPDFMYWQCVPDSNWTKFWEELREKFPTAVFLIYEWPKE